VLHLYSKCISQKIEVAAKVSSKLLTQQNSDAAFANPNLQLLNCSQKEIAKHRSYFLDYSLIRSACWHLASCAMSIFLMLVSRRGNFLSDSLGGSVNAVIVSHMVSEPSAEGPVDGYFGNLCEKLSDVGISSTTLFINHMGRNGYRSVNKNSGVYVTSPYRELKSELFILLDQISSSFRLWKYSLKEQRASARHFVRCGISASVTGVALSNRRIACQLFEGINELDPSYVILTYEGHGWERLLIRAINRNKPDIKIIGYNHSVILNGHRAIDCSFGKDSLPDFVVTAGHITGDLLKNTPTKLGLKPFALGSPKAADFVGHEKKTDGGQAIVLLAPEGVKDEVLAFLQLAKELVSLGCFNEIRLRLHPLMQNGTLRSWFDENFDYDLPIVVSDCRLDEDIAAASLVVYRASAVAISSLAVGTPVVFYDLAGNSEFNDPIDPGLDLHFSASTSGQMETILSEIKALMSVRQKRTVSTANAQRYAQKYFCPWSSTAISKIFLANNKQ